MERRGVFRAPSRLLHGSETVEESHIGMPA